jgi:hypothetical protein
MIGPRASGPPNVAREVFPELEFRERAGCGEIISSLDIAITWVTRKAAASCVTPSRLRRSRELGDDEVDN